MAWSHLDLKIRHHELHHSFCSFRHHVEDGDPRSRRHWLVDIARLHLASESSMIEHAWRRSGSKSSMFENEPRIVIGGPRFVADQNWGRRNIDRRRRGTPEHKRSDRVVGTNMNSNEPCFR